MTGWVSRMVRFLRAGYPSGMPATGYVPLLALLPRRVSDDEIDAITIELITREGRSIDSADVGVEISRITDEMPSLDDIERVKRRVAAPGWAGNYHG